MVVNGEIGEDSSRNLLHRFGANYGDDSSPEVAASDVGVGGDSCEIELSLGLSLNGCFGVEPKEKRLIRSSSISSFSIFPIEHNVPLTRTCSLLAETEEERRNRKEVGSFKRMEGKRKRSENKGEKDRKDENFDEDLNNLNHNNNNKGDQVFSGQINGVAVNGEVCRWVMWKGVNGGGRPASQGSIGSQGSSSSTVSDFESKPMQGVDVSGLSNCAEVKSPSTTTQSASNTTTNEKASTTANITTIRLATNQANEKASTTANIMTEADEPSKKKGCGRDGVKEESKRNMLEEMPCVSAKGDGPNGRRIEGFLYNYRKGGEVRILCVCHGQFLTPAEFVKHAGGGDVPYPLRHIVVNPTPASL